MKKMNFDDIFIQVKLPEPLEKDELYACFEKFKNGDLHAREYIIVHNIKLVIYRILEKFKEFPFEKNELVSVGLIGLINSVDTFDISKNYEFASYAIKCIDNEVLMFARKNKKYISNQSIYNPIGVDEQGNEKKIEDIIIDDTVNFPFEYEDKIIYERIRKIVFDLPDIDKKIIMLYFGFINNEVCIQQKIAEELNICQSYVSRLIKSTLKKIQLELEAEELFENSNTINNDSVKLKQKTNK